MPPARLEFVAGDRTAVLLPPGWLMAQDEHQTDETGGDSGSELKTPPMHWHEREQIRQMLARLRATGAQANWSCGVHLDVGLEPWGESAVLALVEAAISHAGRICRRCPALCACAPGTAAVTSLRHQHRSLVHIGTVEIRYANAWLDYDEVIRTIALCLRFAAAVGAGRQLPQQAIELATALGAPLDGYPPDSGGAPAALSGAAGAPHRVN